MNARARAQRAYRERKRVLDEQREFQEFLQCTAFSSSTTEEEKFELFQRRRRSDKAEERRQKNANVARIKRLRHKLEQIAVKDREWRAAHQLQEQEQEQEPEQEQRAAAGRVTRRPGVLSTRFSGCRFGTTQARSGRLWFERVERSAPELSSKMLPSLKLQAANPIPEAGFQKTNMASSSEDPYQVVSEDLESQRRQLRCINRCCKYGNTLIKARKIVCSFYDVGFRRNREVCLTCYTECLEHYEHLEKLFKNGDCIMEAHFPNYDTFMFLESSSSEEEEEEEPKLGTSRESLPPNQDVVNAINSAVTLFLNEKKPLLDHQVKLCDEYIDKGVSKVLADADEIDEMVLDLESEMEDLKKDFYYQYKPTVTQLEPVDLDDLEENIEKEEEEEKVNMLIEAAFKTPKEDKRLKLDTSDNEDVITIDRTVCVVPSNIPVEGALEYPSLEAGQTVFAKESTLIQAWCRSKIKSIVNPDYVHVLFDNHDKLLTINEVAFTALNPVRFPVGCRVIAKFTDFNSNHIEEFFAGIVAEPPKILNDFRYLIFFDAGFAQYRQHQDIRLTARRNNISSVHNIVHEDFKDFIKSYLEKYPDRQMVKLTNQHSVRVKHKQQWQTAKVLEVDASLVKLYFTDFKHSEWIYRGSSRLYNIFEKQSNYERGIRLRQSGLAYLNKPFVEFTSIEEEPYRILSKRVARKSTAKNSTTLGEGTQKCNKKRINVLKTVDTLLPNNVPDPKIFKKHDCSPLCIEWTAYDYSKTRQISMLLIPLYFGFARYLVSFTSDQLHKCVMYKTPCGVSIRSIKQMLDYLYITESSMTIDQFDYNSWVKPFAELKVTKCVQYLKDISEGKEFRGIPCVNNLNSTLPPKMDYMTTRLPMPGVNINVESDFLCGCDCTDGCQDKSKCACWQMTISGLGILPKQYKDPNIGYSYRRLPECVITGIYECNKTCKCSSTCSNRVVQNPLSQKLQLFMTEKKGWGVRCLNDIPQGGFICIYVGYLLTETDANEGGKNYGDEYLAELDYIEVIESVKEGFEREAALLSDNENESNSDDEHLPSTADGKRSEMAYGLRKRKKLKTKKDGKRVQASSKSNARDMKNHLPQKPLREHFGNNESVYIMDAKTCGNIGRYFNHSCSPNIFVQNVFVDTHDLRFPWIGFFAHNYIKAGSELTWNYSYDVGSVPGKNLKCHCESVYCKGRLL